MDSILYDVKFSLEDKYFESSGKQSNLYIVQTVFNSFLLRCN